MRHELARAKIRLAKRLHRIQVLDARRSYARQNNFVFDRDVDREQIYLPDECSLHDRHDDLTNMLTLLRNATLVRGVSAMLHFEDVVRIDPAAAIVLLAEIHRIRNLRGVDSVLGTYPRLRTVYDHLVEMGFYRLLSVSELDNIPAPEASSRRPVFLRFITGNRVDATLVDSFVSVLEKHIFTMNEKARGRLVAAVVEAMANTLDHAHPTPVPGMTMTNRWWMTSWVDLAAQEVTIMLFDQGVGIPVTLEPTAYESIRAALIGFVTLRGIAASPLDGEMILAATEFHRSSTGQPGRGKGFKNMKQFVDICTDGELRVLSNRGRYSYVAGRNECGDMINSIGGTLVEWRFRHNGSVEIDDE